MLGGINARLGQFVRALRRVTITYSNEADSVGVRNFLNEHLVAFAKANKSVSIVVSYQPRTVPIIAAEFMNERGGEQMVRQINRADSDGINAMLADWRERGGVERKKRVNNVSVESLDLSVQGTWTPFSTSDVVVGVERKQSERMGSRKLLLRKGLVPGKGPMPERHRLFAEYTKWAEENPEKDYEEQRRYAPGRHPYLQDPNAQVKKVLLKQHVAWAAPREQVRKAQAAVDEARRSGDADKLRQAEEALATARADVIHAKDML